MINVFNGSFEYSINKNDNLYIVSKKDNNYVIKRINLNDNSDIVIIKINNNKVNMYFSKELKNIEKDNNINSIFNVLNSNETVKCFLDLDSILYNIKNSYINNLISDNKILLSARGCKCNYIDIVSLDNYSIVGNIIIGEDIIINVIEDLKVETLNLLSNYLLLFKQNNVYKKIKVNN